MVTLSVDRINASSPYRVFASVDEGFVEFTTDYGVRYSVGFYLTSGLISYDTYQFYIINVNHQRSPRDRKLKDTIMAIVCDFFVSGDSAMLYLCDTGDERQSMRNRLFEYWARTSCIQYDISIMSACLTDSEGVRNYASLLLRTDNPYYSEIIAEFTQTVKLLDDKPSHNE